MSEPKKHHYLPEFFLSAWYNPKMLVQYRKPILGKVTTRDATTGMVGYEFDLYRLYSETIPEQRTIETNHFQVLDSKAAPIVARLNKDHRDRLTDQDRYRLARFFLSLPARTPWGIEKAREIAREVYPRELGDPEFARELKLPEGTTALDLYQTNPHFMADMALITMMEAHTDPKKVDRIRRLDWIVINTQDAGLDLILGDNAFMLDGNLLDPETRTFIAIPLGPSRLLVITNGGIKTTMSNRDLVKIVNRESAQRAKERFFAKDRSHIALAEKWLKVFTGRNPV